MSGQNYIGSKISLISLSDIRYVGILHNINSLESTVALQNVQSFGTEGRKSNPNEEILPSDNIFDYVVFRGSDIKDLQVFEAPPSYKSEPTVIHQQQVSSSHDNMKPSSSYYPSNPQYSYTAPPTAAYGNYWQNNNTNPSTSYSISTQQQFQQTVPPPQNMRMPVPENYQQGSTYSTAVIKDEQEEKTVAASPSEKGVSTDIQEKEEVDPMDKVNKVEEDENNIVDSLAKQVSELDIKTSDLSKVSQERIYKQQQQQQQKSVTKGTTKKSVSISTVTATAVKNNGKNSEAKNNTRSNTVRESTATTTQAPNNHHNRRRRSTGGNKSNSSNNLPDFRSDFDFASSNAKFDKSEIIAGDHPEKDKIIIPKPEQFYNKEKSFFDDISCESKEFNKGSCGSKHQEERRLNMETFGQANPIGNGQNGKRHRHRGRGRGRSYRGKEKNKMLANEENPRVEVA